MTTDDPKLELARKIHGTPHATRDSFSPQLWAGVERAWAWVCDNYVPQKNAGCRCVHCLISRREHLEIDWTNIMEEPQPPQDQPMKQDPAPSPAPFAPDREALLAAIRRDTAHAHNPFNEDQRADGEVATDVALWYFAPLLAERDALRKERDELRTLTSVFRLGSDEERKAKDQAYRERNMAVCALSKVLPAWLGEHNKNDAEWEAEWRNIVFVQLATGQASWHIHDSELPNFAHLARGGDKWDGHTTEQKHERIQSMHVLLPTFKAMHDIATDAALASARSERDALQARVDSLYQFYKDARKCVDGYCPESSPIEALRNMRKGFDNVCEEAKTFHDKEIALQAEVETLKKERDDWVKQYGVACDAADKLREEVVETNASLELRWKADMRGIRAWQAAGPDRELTWPDHAKLVEWLLNERDAALARVRELEGAGIDVEACAREIAALVLRCKTSPGWAAIADILRKHARPAKRSVTHEEVSKMVEAWLVAWNEQDYFHLPNRPMKAALASVGIEVVP